MPRVRLHAPLRFNLTGWDREPLELAAGEQEVPDAVAAFVRSHPDLGEVVEGARGKATRSRAGRAQGAGTRDDGAEAEEEA